MLKRAFAFFCNRKPKSDYNFDNISSALFRPYRLMGDAVILTAAFAQLKDAYPHIKIGVIVCKQNIEIFKRCPLVDKVINENIYSAIKERNKWQLFLDYRGLFSTSGMLFDKILAADFVVCFDKAYKKHYNLDTVHNYDVYCPNKPRSPLNSWLKFTPFANKIKTEPTYVLTKPEKFLNPFDGKDCGYKNIFLCVEGSKRALPLKLLSDFLSKFPHQPFKWVISNTPKASEYYEELKKIHGLDITLAKKTDIDGYFAYIYFADAIFSVDTSAVHIAAAFQKPLAAIYANSTDNLLHVSQPYYEGLALIHSQNLALNNNDFSGLTLDELTEKTVPFFEKLKNGGGN